MWKRYPACLHLPTALPPMLLAFAMLVRDVAICSHGLSAWSRSPGSGAAGRVSYAGAWGAGAECGV